LEAGCGTKSFLGNSAARESHLRVHVTPRFGDAALSEIGVHQLQQFATDLRKTVSRKTVVHILTTIFGVVHYAKRCGITVNRVAFANLELGTRDVATVVPFFTREQATQIVEAAKQPHKTLFALAWFTGLRSGELLALTVDDLNFNDHTIRVNKSADDLTQAVRQPKTKCSVAMLPMPSELESVLRNYLDSHWQPNEGRILFPAKSGTRARSRRNVVVHGLHPVLRKLGIPTLNAGLHAFRHGLATALVEASAPISVLQTQMRTATFRQLCASTLTPYNRVTARQWKASGFNRYELSNRYEAVSVTDSKLSGCKEIGAGCGTRTHDLGIMRTGGYVDGF
jgi:integrase